MDVINKGRQTNAIKGALIPWCIGATEGDLHASTLQKSLADVSFSFFLFNLSEDMLA